MTTVSHRSQRVFEAAPVPLQQATLGAAIRFRAETQPDQPALVSSGFAPLSYRELQYQIRDVRAALRTAGFSRSARIAVAMPNGPQAALAIVAVACSAVSIPLNPKQTLREIEMGFTALPPDAVLLVKGDGCDARRAAERRGLTIIEATPWTDGTLGFGIVVQQAGSAAARDEPDEPDPDTPAFILQTSGTAAEPKLIPFSHRNMLAAAARIQAWFNLTAKDRCLSVSPAFYSHGLKVTVFTPLLSGGTVAFPTDASKFDYAEWFEDLRPTWYSAGPTLHRLILDQAQSRTDAKTGHSLRLISSGGAPLPRNVLEGLQDTLGVPVLEHYGSSEAALTASNVPPPGRYKPGTCGVPCPDTVMIAGEDGHPLPPGAQGEILVGGPTLISGYLNAPELNRASFLKGWFKTGDIGSLDEDGFLTLHGRINDMINRGGEKISPIEIDEALMRHPAVAEAAAFSVPHARLGEDVAAAVVLRTGVTVTPVALRRYLQDQLASFKVPQRIVIRDQLPRGKTGKVVRRELSGLSEEKVAAETKITAPAPRLSESTDSDSTLLSQVTELWERLLQIAPVSLDDDFSEKGGDSLLAVEMLCELERLTGKTIPSSILFEARTIRQLAQVLSQPDIQPKSVVKMNPSGGLAPIVLFHGDCNGGLYAARLASLLGADQPLLVVAPHDLGKDPILLPIEAIAADSLPVILNAQPKGPYRLCGYCLGGLIAFEVARLLVAAGEKVEMVGMIDSPTVSARRYVQLLLSAMRLARPIAGPVVDRMMPLVWHKCSRLDRPWQFSVAQRYAWIRHKVLKRLIGHRNQVPSPTVVAGGIPSRLAEFFKPDIDCWPSTVFAMSVYSPKALAVPVVYFASEYGAAAWRRISSDIVNIKLPGNHSEAVRDPANLATIANYLRTGRPPNLLERS